MKQIIRAAQAISEAQMHHLDLRRAIQDDEYGHAMRAHRHLGRCLDTADRCLRGLSDGAELGGVGKTIGKDIYAPNDDSEDIIEVMGHSARELTDRFHLLRLAQLLFGLALLG